MTRAKRVHSTPRARSRRKTAAIPHDAIRALPRLRREARDEIDRLIQFLDSTDPYVATELEGEHDGREPDDEGGEAAHEDDEPSLGWTESGNLGNRNDLEEGLPSRPPQGRSEVEGASAVYVETIYRKFVHGLTDGQKKRLQRRMRSDSGVSLR